MQTNLFSGLSLKEQLVAELVADGLSNSEIGKILGMAEKTVKYHTSNIFRKLGVKTRSRLIVKAYEFREENGAANA